MTLPSSGIARLLSDQATLRGNTDAREYRKSCRLHARGCASCCWALAGEDGPRAAHNLAAPQSATFSTRSSTTSKFTSAFRAQNRAGKGAQRRSSASHRYSTSVSCFALRIQRWILAEILALAALLSSTAELFLGPILVTLSEDLGFPPRLAGVATRQQGLAV